MLLLFPLGLKAEWKDLREGLEVPAVILAIGQPLIKSRTRAGLFETWTYDRGGYAVFVRARLSYWREPRHGP